MAGRELVNVWKDFFVFETIPWWLRSPTTGFGWNFSNLEDAFKENGVLHGNKVYLYCYSEVQIVPVINVHAQPIMVPVILAVESPTPPSDKVAVEYKSSMECFEEKIVHTNDLNFGWIPYNIPTAESHESPRIFMLSCEDREILGQLKSQGVTSCTPYILNPLREDDTEQNTFVRIQYPPVTDHDIDFGEIENEVIDLDFDFEKSEIEEFTDGFITLNILSEDQKGHFMELVTDKVNERKTANMEVRRLRESLTPGDIDTFKNMRFYKFYPVSTHKSLHLRKDPYINDFYGDAHQVL